MKYYDFPPRNKIYRAGRDARILGVCAGLSKHFGFDRSIVRLLTAIGAFVFFPTVIVAYFILALLLEKAPEDERPDTAYDAELRQRVRSEPHATVNSQRHRFRELDRRLQRLEKYVTSKRFRLDREFEGLKD